MSLDEIGAMHGRRRLVGVRRLHEHGPTRGKSRWSWWFPFFDWELHDSRFAMIPQIRDFGGGDEHVIAYMRSGDTGNIPVYE